MTKEFKLEDKIIEGIDFTKQGNVLLVKDVKESIKKVKYRLQKGENINKVFLEEFGDLK